MLKKWIFISVLTLLLLFVGLFFLAMKQAHSLQRDPIVLMNQYYRLKETHPDVAKTALLLILEHHPNHIQALKEYTQWLLNHADPLEALPWLQQLHALLPMDGLYAFQLGYLYDLMGDWDQAAVVLQSLQMTATGPLKAQVHDVLLAMASYVPFYQDEATGQWFQSFPSHGPLLLGEGPTAIPSAQSSPKKKSLSQGDNKKSVDVVWAHKEAGFLALKRKEVWLAIHEFTQAYELSHQPDIAMQLGYLYDGFHNKTMAYRYFSWAAQSKDKALSLEANQALTQLSGQQTKRLPAPYFSEVYFNPFTETRFGLTVLPVIARLGIEQRNPLQTKEYVFLRRTQDNRSKALGVISQIYEDNVQVTGIGGQMSPFKRLPVVAFLEAGEAYDLVYRNRNRWRGDLRGGVMYYQEFGVRPGYFDTLRLSHDYYSDWYADVTYFSRYNNNVIGLVRTHQGIHLLQYQSSLLNLYVTGRMIGDSQRIFYNNIAEIGPGIAFIPSDRLNIQVRFEHVHGVYLPAAAVVNPYRKHYTNQIVQFLFYVKW